MLKLALFLLFMPFILAHGRAGYPDYYRYQILINDPTTSSVTYQSFTTIPRIILGLHSKTLSDQKIDAFVMTDWEKPFFSAWAFEEKDKRFSLNFWGGLARIPGMNDEAFALVACHELAHLVGGDPRMKLSQFKSMSSEGQSDFYASAICMKNYLRFKHRQNKLNIPQDISGQGYTLCRTNFDEEEDFLICLHTQKAILAFMDLLQHQSSASLDLDLVTPDPSQVRVTLHDSYPSPQCRIDTLLMGSLCSIKDYPCDSSSRARPGCWFSEI